MATSVDADKSLIWVCSICIYHLVYEILGHLLHVIKGIIG